MSEIKTWRSLKWHNLWTYFRDSWRRIRFPVRKKKLMTALLNFTRTTHTRSRHTEIRTHDSSTRWAGPLFQARCTHHSKLRMYRRFVVAFSHVWFLDPSVPDARLFIHSLERFHVHYWHVGIWEKMNRIIDREFSLLFSLAIHLWLIIFFWFLLENVIWHTLTFLQTSISSMHLCPVGRRGGAS